MSTADISRFLLQPKKHYSGASLQQGRALTDGDFNEEVFTDGEDHRRSIADALGGHGSPDFGFLPELSPGTVIVPKLVRFGSVFRSFVLDYNLRPGTMYAGGMRFELEAAEPVVFQRDFLQMGPLQAPRAAVGTHLELGFLRAWEQVVSPVEDEELLETAMGGPDAMVRVRRMRRVEVATVQSTDCAGAFEEVLESLTIGDTATWNSETGELESNARLKMRFLKPASDEDCPECTPMLSSRYLGSENHTIRVMLTTPTDYVWSYDNAAQLFRVKVFIDGPGRARVKMLTLPKDDLQAPRENTVVEFLPWGALLQNGNKPTGKVAGEAVKNEKVAARLGFFGEVDKGYDPNTNEFEVRLAGSVTGQIGLFTGKDAFTAKLKAKKKKLIGSPLPIDTIALRWDEQHPNASELNPADDGSEGFTGYVFMRVWHAKRPEDPLFIPTSSKQPLGTTGLVPEFLHAGKPGDYWTLSVRPNARDQIVPGELLRDEGARPHGPRDFLMPLFLIQWTSADSFFHTVDFVRDCRRSFRPMTQGGCCTLVVSHGPEGNAATLQRAVDLLPREGGRICVRAGVYKGTVRIEGRRDVIIEGCGPDARIESPDDADGGVLIDIVGPADGAAKVTLEGLGVVAHGQKGIRFTGEGLTLKNLTMEIGPSLAGETPTQSAISIERASDVNILDNRITVDSSFTDHAAVYVETTFDLGGAIIRGNRIETIRNTSGIVEAWGGLHIANGAHNVEIRQNHIIGGNGHGITLGSIVFIAPTGHRRTRLGAGFNQTASSFFFHEVTGNILNFDEEVGTETLTFYPDPARGDDDDVVEITDLLIADNRIEQGNASGISCIAVFVDNPGDIFFDEPPFVRDVLVALRNVSILDNVITGNARGFGQKREAPHAVGGIVLSRASNLDVRGNEIVGNAAGFGSPAGVCGIYVGSGDSIVIESNRIRGNAPVAPSVKNADDRHGGIVIVFPTTFATELQAGEFANNRRDTLPKKCFVRDNVVDQLSGPALWVEAAGPCAVTSNYLSTQGVGPGITSTAGFVGTKTAIVGGLGAPWESVNLPPGEPSPDRWPMQPGGTQDWLRDIEDLPLPVGPFLGLGGAVLFAGNQVTTISTASETLSFSIVVVSSVDHVSVLGNQLTARLNGEELDTHLQAAGTTGLIANNRIAEGVDDASGSLFLVGRLMGSVTANMLTHCYTLLVSQVDEFVEDENNLILFNSVDGCPGIGE